MLYKDVHFKLAQVEWEQLYQIFPGQGERTQFFRQCAREAIRMGARSRFVRRLRERVEEENE